MQANSSSAFVEIICYYIGLIYWGDKVILMYDNQWYRHNFRSLHVRVLQKSNKQNARLTEFLNQVNFYVDSHVKRTKMTQYTQHKKFTNEKISTLSGDNDVTKVVYAIHLCFACTTQWNHMGQKKLDRSFFYPLVSYTYGRM